MGAIYRQVVAQVHIIHLLAFLSYSIVLAGLWGVWIIGASSKKRKLVAKYMKIMKEQKKVTYYRQLTHQQSSIGKPSTSTANITEIQSLHAMDFHFKAECRLQIAF